MPYIAPERVQESEGVRVLVAKDAISTGWDCPRAEVMVSFRAATDRTHITQLLGRMVRTPLARRIPGNERLNAVDCLLPHFNKKSVEAVVAALMTGGEGGEALPGRRVLLNPKEMKPNPDVPEEVWQALLSLPTQSLPRRQARPVKRLTALAHELAADDLLPDAGTKAHAEMHKVLDALQVRYADEIAKAREGVLTVEGMTVVTDVKTAGKSFNAFVEAADRAVIEEAYKQAARLISPDLARTYSEHLAAKALGDEDPDKALIEAHTVIAALGLVPEIKTHLEKEAEDLANRWRSQHRVAIKGLSDERQDIYEQIREMSADPQDGDLTRPNIWMQPTTAREADGTETPLPCFEKHLLCGSDGMFPESFGSSWEEPVVRAELKRPGTLGWYRNPARSGRDSLGVTYEEGDELKIVRPDFIFFAKRADGGVAVDIIDPHGIQFGDALPRMKGLASYAEKHPGVYRRIEVVAQVGGRFRTLDLTEPATRAAVLEAKSAKASYESDVAADYDT